MSDILRNNMAGLGGWDMKDANDLHDVRLPAHLGKSPEVELGPNDRSAQAQAAAQLGYQLHGQKCRQCGEAQEEGALCQVGRVLYQKMREAGVVE